MGTIPSRPHATAAAFWSVFVPSLLLVGLALLAVVVFRTGAAGAAYPLWVATGLLATSLSLYLLRRGDPPGPYWLAFWGAAYLAFAAHLACVMATTEAEWWPP